MATHDIHVVGASAGGVEALRSLVATLPEGFSATLFVVLHTGRESRGLLPSVLQNGSPLPVHFAEDQRPFHPGHIYVAPPDRHLVIKPDGMHVVRGPKENRFRPAIDVLFRSAAWSFGPRVVGVVLTGMLDDGTSGLWTIKTCGGVSVVQDPAEALFSSMPSSALQQFEVDHCLPIGQIGALLVALACQEASVPSTSSPSRIELESQFAMLQGHPETMNRLGQPAMFSCPSCQGALWELHDGEQLRYRCHTGHAFGRESLLGEQSEALEDSLYASLRAMEEKASASRRIADRYGSKFPQDRDRLEKDARDLDEYALVIRNLLADLGR